MEMTMDILNLADILRVVLGKAVEEWSGMLRVHIPEIFQPGDILEIDGPDGLRFPYKVPLDAVPNSEVLVPMPPEIFGKILNEVQNEAGDFWDVTFCLPDHAEIGDIACLKVRGKIHKMLVPTDYTRDQNLVLSVPNQIVDPPAASLARTVSENVEEATNQHRVLGFSHLQCKLLAPLLTRFQMSREGLVPSTQGDRSSSMIELHEDTFHNLFTNHSISRQFFSIPREDLEIVGFGKDRVWAANLDSLLQTIAQKLDPANPPERLAALHVHPDGNCLTHSLSRCLCGQEVCALPSWAPYARPARL